MFLEFLLSAEKILLLIGVTEIYKHEEHHCSYCP